MANNQFGNSGDELTEFFLDSSAWDHPLPDTKPSDAPDIYKLLQEYQRPDHDQAAPQDVPENISAPILNEEHEAKKFTSNEPEKNFSSPDCNRPSTQDVLENFVAIPNENEQDFLLHGFDLNGPLDVPENIFAILPNEKKRGEKYKFAETEKLLITKPGSWVPFKVKRPGMVKISMRYEDEQHYNSVMEACKNCCTAPLFKDYDGPFKVKYQGKELSLSNDHSGHLYVGVNVVQTEDVVKVAFQCNNSCQTHKNFGKRRCLILEFELMVKWKLPLRVSVAIKRDYTDITEGPKKKMMKAEPESTNASQSEVDEPIPLDDQVLNGQMVITIDSENQTQHQQPEIVMMPLLTQPRPQNVVQDALRLVKREFSPVKKGPFAPKQEAETPCKFIVELPSSEKAKAVMQLIDLLGGKHIAF